MGFLTVLFSVFNYLWLYLKGFRHEEIFAKRCEIIQTVIISNLILFGFKPFLKLLTDGCSFFYEWFLQLFFKKKMHQKIILKTTKVEIQNELLKRQLAQNDTKLKKLQSQKERLEKKFRDQNLPVQDEPTNLDDEKLALPGKEDLYDHD